MASTNPPLNSQVESGSGAGSSQGGNIGIGFAVPSNTVRTVLGSLEARAS
ncbi:MAG TPA: hypothetical protein VF257_02875 [Solirubrobacteraceae bacterium]